MSVAATERFDIGRVIGRTTGVIGRNVATFTGLALLLSGAPAALLGLSPLGLSGPLGQGLSGAWLITPITGAWLQAALIRGSVADLNGGRAAFGECLGAATCDILPLIAIGILTTAIFVVGFVFLVVPGVILALVLCVSAPARVVERVGVFAALGRSGDLTRGHRGAIFLVFALYFVAVLVCEIGFGSVAQPLAEWAFFSAGPWDAMFGALVGSAAALLQAAGVASIYFELRNLKDGVGIEALAAAFD